MILLYSWNVYARRSVRLPPPLPPQPRATLFLDSILICPFVSDTKHHTFVLNIDFSISGISLPFTCVYELYLCVCKHAQHIHIPIPVRSITNPQYQNTYGITWKYLPYLTYNQMSHKDAWWLLLWEKPLPKTLFNRHIKVISKDRHFPSTRRPFNAISIFSHNSQNRFPSNCKTIRIQQSWYLWAALTKAQQTRCHSYL